MLTVLPLFLSSIFMILPVSNVDCSAIVFVWYLGATRGVAVSMSAFLACHQFYCAGLSFAWGLNLRPVVCDIFLKLVARGFLWVLGFPPLLHRFNDSANKIKLK